MSKRVHVEIVHDSSPSMLESKINTVVNKIDPEDLISVQVESASAGLVGVVTFKK